ncbi:unnamed protein product [Prunus armeniaca]
MKVEGHYLEVPPRHQYSQSVVVAGRCRRLALRGCTTEEDDDVAAWDPPGPASTWSCSISARAVAADTG